MSATKPGIFRSLRIRNYRLWAGGALVSNIGTWMQRTAQDWIVLTELTRHNATSVGIVMGLQFGPQVLLLPFTGLAADRLDRRKLLLATQTTMGLLALGLGLLCIAHIVQLWQVYVFAFVLGCVSAFDAPARQTFVSELVDEEHLSNAVGLNSTSFNAARMIGPAIAGILIAAIGSGWVFVINAVSFAAVVGALMLLRLDELHVREKQPQTRGSFVEGLRYTWGRPDLVAVLAMLFLVGTFAVNFPIFIATMSVSVFHAGASQYGLLSSMMAIGSVGGSLLAAQRERPRIAFLLAGAAALGIGLLIAAVMPNFWSFAIALVFVGLSGQTFSTTSLGALQLWTEPAMRGRVMAIALAIALGGTPIGAPLVGWIADTFGPRWSIAAGAASGLLAALVAIRYLVRYRHLRMRFERGMPRFGFDVRTPAPVPVAPAEEGVVIEAEATESL